MDDIDLDVILFMKVQLEKIYFTYPNISLENQFRQEFHNIVRHDNQVLYMYLE